MNRTPSVRMVPVTPDGKPDTSCPVMRRSQPREAASRPPPGAPGPDTFRLTRALPCSPMARSLNELPLTGVAYLNLKAQGMGTTKAIINAGRACETICGWAITYQLGDF